MLMYSLRKPRDHDYFIDHIKSTPPDQCVHPWAQSETEATYLIERLTEPGDLVVDPMMGSGTFCRAAIKLGRRAIGIEINRHAYEVAVALCAA